jgi:N-acetylglucosaminyldiphosphoundecaprenol N-acetyl-beta-D-mannosaminyltransferase
MSAPHAGSKVGGVRVDARTADEFTIAVGALLEDGESHVVHFLASHAMSLARRNSRYRETLNSGDLNIADGVGVTWALRLAGHRPSRLPSSDAMSALCDWGISRGLRHSLYGWTEDRVAQLRSHLEAAHPGIAIVGVHAPVDPSLSRKGLREDREQIHRYSPDALWVGLGTPTQDLVAEELRRHASAPVILSVGAAFDFLSGARRRAPRWMQRIGLEWLHRLASEPRRLWRRYLLESPGFVLAAARDRISARGR